MTRKSGRQLLIDSFSEHPISMSKTIGFERILILVED